MADNEKEPKRYYWLKLQSTYFNQLEQKKMRKQEDGKDMQIVYLRMMLLSIDKGGYIYFQGVYDTLEEELAEEFNEPLELVRKTLSYLQQNGMISVDENSDCFVPEALEHTGSECYSAERVRKHREKIKALQCNSPVTAGNEEKELKKKTESEKKQEGTNYQQIADMYNDTCVSFPRLTKLSEKRKKAINARLRTYTVDDFKKLFEMAESSNFLKGQNNRNWSATFDWLISDGNMAKVLDGNYANSPKREGYNRQQEHDTSFTQTALARHRIEFELPNCPDGPFQ